MRALEALGGEGLGGVGRTPLTVASLEAKAATYESVVTGSDWLSVDLQSRRRAGGRLK